MNMRFWIREIMGWLLVGLGLFVFYMCVVLLFNHYITEVGMVFIIGIVVFRGGIIPPHDIAALKALGVKELFGPGTSTQDIVRFVNEHVRAAV